MENATKLPFGLKIGTQAYTGVVHLAVTKRSAWAASIGQTQYNLVAWCSGKRGIHGVSEEPEGTEITCKRCAAHLAKVQREKEKAAQQKIKDEAYAAKMAAQWAK